MSINTINTGLGTFTLDAQPDRPDVRDRLYSPPLRPIPQVYPDLRLLVEHLDRYCGDGMILDQGEEGACTGFGLAAVVNYLSWSQARLTHDQKVQRATLAKAKPPIWTPPPKVSERMFYHLARTYDEWPGEDYDGSSARGALKAWFHHGVCKQDLWPYFDPLTNRSKFICPLEDSSKDAVNRDWRANAATRPLGAYYRLDTFSCPDIQAAIAEVGAVYVSANVHAGWDLPKSTRVPLIDKRKMSFVRGGHAFTLMGYDEIGFFVQNSWGQDWGYCGFARLTYEDWLANSTDAWVASMGAHTAAPAPSLMISSTRTLPPAIARLGRGAAFAAASSSGGISAAAKNWDASVIEKHALALGNDGRPFAINVQHESAEASVRYVTYNQPKAWFDTNPGQKRKIAIFAHGGLNSLSAGLERTSVMAPYFVSNGIWPVFAVWQSGILDTIGSAMADYYAKELEKQGPAGGILKNLAEAASERFDGFLEASVARLVGKPVWSEMKENARLASEKGGALLILAQSLSRLAGELGEIEVHLIGHSAGAVMLGALLEPLRRYGVTLATCSLYAPACTLEFALATFGRALRDGHLKPKTFSLDILSDERERADRVTAYGKSLLYLISRGLEPDRSAPILGMHAVFDPEFDRKPVFHSREYSPNSSLLKWRDLWGGLAGIPQPKIWSKAKVSDGESLIDVNHGCFDNSVEVVRATLERIRGGKLIRPVKSLKFG